MKTPKQTTWLALMLGGGLWMHGILQAQPAPDAKPDTTTVATATNAPLAEAAEQTNRNESASTNEPATSEQQRERGPLVSIGHDAELKAGETAEAVVVIGGSGKIDGKVRQAAVAVFGDLEVNGEVEQDAVAVFGNLIAGPNAKIHGETVAVGGKVEASPTAVIRGEPVSVDFPNWLKKWFVQCVLKLRPLAPQVGWVWGVAGVFFLLYLLIAAVFPTPVQACVSELTRRPASTFLFGLIAKLLLPLIMLILAATGVGLLVAPFIMAALMLGAILGKVALLEWLGFKIARQFGTASAPSAVVGLVIGSIILTILYMIPVLGLLTFMIASVWGLGAAVTAAFGGLKKEMPAKRVVPIQAASPVGAWPTQTASAEPFNATPSGATDFGPGATPAAEAATATATLPTAPPILPEVLSYPRAGFWERMGAGLLDFILVGILGGLTHFPPLGFLVALAYFAAMWTWKGTTIGGIVLGLKVVRADGGAVTFAAALVRALAAAFSIFVLFLGFLWIAWDGEKQGWHDKIAGTVVLRLPRGTPLVCL